MKDQLLQHIKDRLILDKETVTLANKVYKEEYADGCIDLPSFMWGFCHAYFLNKSMELKLELSNHQVQDILDDMGMIDENGNCLYTAEEIFKVGVEYAKEKMIDKACEWMEWIRRCGSFYGTYIAEGSIRDFRKAMEE